MSASTNASRAGGQKKSLEYGVRFRSAADEFIAAGYTESGARSMVEHYKSVDDCKGLERSPAAVEVMVQDVSEWRSAEVKP